MQHLSNSARSFLLLLLFVIISCALFAPSFDRGFVSDDYCILDFLFKHNGFLVDGFFRPVGDLTLKLTHLLGGESPGVFYVSNAILHGFNAWLVYLLCERLRSDDHRKIFPASAAILFLFFHSVGEVVMWTIGRGISLAVTFALISMIAFVSRANVLLKYVVVCTSYFVAISAYESVLLLPVVILSLAFLYRMPVNYFIWSLLLSSTLAVNLAIRILVTGKLWAPYKGVIWAKGPGEYVETFIKSAMRLFVPAFNQPFWFVIAGLVIFSVIAFLLLRKRGSILGEATARWAVIGILASLLIVMFYGASTRTVEGDRLLYWPAVFVSILLATMLMRINRLSTRMILLIAVCIIQAFFIFRTQQTWLEADRLSKAIIRQLKEKTQRPLYLINLPSEFRGAFMFRNCFGEALKYNGIDPSEIHVVNQLNFAGAGGWDGTATFTDSRGSILIGPSTRVEVAGDSMTSIESQGKALGIPPTSLKHVLYWNKDSLVEMGK